MRTIRRNMFETNSSSTHSITFCTQEQFNEFCGGAYIVLDEKLVALEEMREKILRSDSVDEEDKADFDSKSAEELTDIFGNGMTYNQWCEGDEDGSWGPWSACYTTPGGEKIVAFGTVGHDG